MTMQHTHLTAWRDLAPKEYAHDGRTYDKVSPFEYASESGILKADRFSNWVLLNLLVRTPQLRGKACQRYINLPY